MKSRTFERHLAGEVNGLDEKKLDAFVGGLNPVRVESLLAAVLRRVSREKGPGLFVLLDPAHHAEIRIVDVLEILDGSKP